jgi:radical SAM superfamily enzyme YgiQ (UPF0313 family)
MKILLVEPPKAQLSVGGEDVFLFEPLALEYVGAGVLADHDVRLLDMRLDHDLAGALEELTPDVVGFTAYTVHVDVVKALAAEVKAWKPNTLTVVGGHHATVAPEDLHSPHVDLVVAGEGVFAFREAVRRLERGDSFRGIPGVAVVEPQGLAIDQPAAGIDLDSLPFPARRLSSAYREHYYSEWMRPLASIRTSKGCPFRCSFCSLWKLTGGRYLGREPDRIVEELAGIDETFVFFADDESLVEADRMAALARQIETAGIRKRYFLYGRADTIARHPDLLEAWRRIGLERVFVGLEFFRDSDLQFINKSSSTGDNAEAVRVLHDLGIEIHASFIVRPEFDRSDFKALNDYCHELEVDFAGFAVLTPLPGTDLMDQVEDRLLTENPAFFDFIHTVLPTSLPLEEFYRQYTGLIRSAMPLGKRIALLRKFGLSRLPFVLFTTFRLVKRLRTLHLDYQGLM